MDILVNNAGYLARANFEDVSMEDIDKSMAVNLKSAVKLSQLPVHTFRKIKSETAVGTGR